MPGLHPFLDHGGPIGLAHRGGAGDHPENTERAFRHAVDLGFTHIETDVHVTSDGVAVAIHDSGLDRVTDREGKIADLPWSEVSKARVDGTDEIMRLEELLEAFPDTFINLDAKAASAVRPLAETILRTKATDRVLVGAFSDRRIDQVKGLVGDDLATSAGPRRIGGLLLRSLHIPVPVSGIVAAQVPLKFGPVPIVNARFVDSVHRQGLHIHVWTVNEADEMTRLLDLGVDGIMTDRPKVLRDVFVARGIWTN